MAGYEVGSAFLTVMPSAKGFGSSLSGELDGPFQAAGLRGGTQIGDGVGTSGKKSFVGAGKSLGAAFAGAFVAVGAFEVIKSAADYLSSAISAASDLAETQSKVGQIFGDSTDKVLAFAKTADKSLGQSEQSALDGAATFGIFAKAAGLTGDASANFSTSLLTLAGDLASFNNTSPDDAIQALGSALRGESEPIRAYGVLLDDATLKARAMSIGIYQASVDEVQVANRRQKLADATTKLTEVQRKHGEGSDEAVRQTQKVAEAEAALQKSLDGGTGTLTAAQRVQAAYGEILAQTSTQQGDFSRTSDGMANQQRILTAELDNTKAEIGTALLPVALELFKMFAAEGVPILKDLADWFTQNKDGIKAFALGTIDAALWIIQAFLGLMEHMSRMQEFWIMVGTNMIQTWLNVAEGVINAAVTMFGWVPGVGDKLRGVQAAFGEVRDDADLKFGLVRAAADKMTAGFEAGQVGVQGLRDKIRALDGATATVHILTAANPVLDIINPGRRATGGPVSAGTPYIVGENSAELFVPDRNGMIYNQAQLANMGGSGNAGIGGDVTWNLYETVSARATAMQVARMQNASAAV